MGSKERAALLLMQFNHRGNNSYHKQWRRRGFYINSQQTSGKWIIAVQRSLIHHKIIWSNGIQGKCTLTPQTSNTFPSLQDFVITKNKVPGHVLESSEICQETAEQPLLEQAAQKKTSYFFMK
jgi:hypothetical protein